MSSGLFVGSGVCESEASTAEICREVLHVKVSITVLEEVFEGVKDVCMVPIAVLSLHHHIKRVQDYHPLLLLVEASEQGEEPL